MVGRLCGIRSGVSQTEDLETPGVFRDLWSRARLLGSLIGKGEFRVGKVEILGEYSVAGRTFRPPSYPPQVGTPAEELKPDDPHLRSIMLKNHSGYDMAIPVYIGRVFGSDLDAFVDIEKVVSMHMAVLGATGSGKTTFVRKVLRNLEGVSVFLFDMYDEYGEDLKDKTTHLTVPNILMPVDWEDVKRLLREGGMSLSERSSEEREFASAVRRMVKPDLRKTALKEMSLEEVLEKGLKGLRDKHLREGVMEALGLLKEILGKEAVRDQPLLVNRILKALEGEKGVLFNLREVDLPETRVAIGGLVIRELLKLIRSSPRDRLLVIEEAHNFAPERGIWDVQAGRENLAYTGIKRVALEGRKFRLGLVAITQRPANISKFILSQLNTQVIFKLITKNDLEAVSVFFEHSKEDVFKLLPSLRPGTAFITGLGVPFGFLFRMEEIPDQAGGLR